MPKWRANNYEEELIVVKANSVKEAIHKFHDYKINSEEMYERFENWVSSSLENDYFEWISEKGKDEYDWNSAIEKFFRSKKVFGNKRKYKDINVDKVVKERMGENSDWNEVSNETKESIFIWLYEDIGALNLNKVRVLE
ncbi:hypothetical protein HGI33_18195 [Clostridium saccharobutylicum]|nr:hypothetical protein [Clostridium saccharobutylicum]